jgi:hypothetical protein
VKAIHIVALAVAFGGAIAADLFFLTRAVFRPIESATIAVGHFLGEIVAAGLVVLWFTGIMLVATAYHADPQVIYNEKLWVKIFIVTILTVNAFVIHGIVLPTVAEQEGRRLFDYMPLSKRLVLAASGATSVVSWLFPTVLGTAKELNFKVPGYQILGCYYVALVVAAVGLSLLAVTVGRWRRSPFAGPNSLRGVPVRSAPQEVALRRLRVDAA